MKGKQKFSKDGPLLFRQEDKVMEYDKILKFFERHKLISNASERARNFKYFVRDVEEIKENTVGVQFADDIDIDETENPQFFN